MNTIATTPARGHQRPRPSMACRLVATATFCIALVCAAGCQKPARQDAAQVAQAGTTYAKQLDAYYGSLADDVQRTWELNAFDDAYQQERIALSAHAAGQPPPAPAATGDAIAAQYRAEYSAILARRDLADRFEGLYAAFSHLADYDASAEVTKNANDLSQAVSGLTKFPLPAVGGTTASLSGGVLTDLVRQAGVVAQNKDLGRSNQAIVAALADLQAIITAERPVYDGIAKSKAAEEMSLAQELVGDDAVTSGGLFTDVLGAYSLSWNVQATTQQATVKAGIKALIAARSNRLLTLSTDASRTVTEGLDQLITLHRQLQTGAPLSLADFVETSETARILLQQLGTGASQDDVAAVIRLLQGGPK